MLTRGDIVRILPEFQDAGDDGFSWIVVGDEEKGRVDISPDPINLKIKPVYTLKVDQVELIEKARLAL